MDDESDKKVDWTAVLPEGGTLINKYEKRVPGNIDRSLELETAQNPSKGKGRERDEYPEDQLGIGPQEEDTGLESPPAKRRRTYAGHRKNNN